MAAHNAFRPRRTALALEPRILFDGAAGVAVEQQVPDAPAPEVAAPAPEAPPRTLVVIDTRLDDYQGLARQAAPGAEILLIDAAQDGLAAISERLAAGGQVDSIQILSHGAAGQFILGSRAVSADNVASLSETLRAWAPQLTADADILLYGCGVGAGESGRTLITALAAATGADVAASTNNTGSATAGGDWTLEVATGAIETNFTADAYAGLLVNAEPTVTLSGTPTEALLGGQFSFTASFANTETSGQAGYAPFIDLILPATGKDGAGAEIDDGITFVSATYLGQTVNSFVLTFDAAGNATHPLAKDSTGTAVIVTGTPGDQLVVLQLPYASVLKGQPAIDVIITCQLSELADTTGTPALNVKVRGGFEYGNDSANNPVSDPSLFGGISAFNVTPSGLTLTQTINMPEGETVTGPNFERSLTVTATPPPGQTLTDVNITQSLPQTIRVNSITPASGGTITSITLADGSTVTNSVFITAVLAQSPFLSSYTIRYASLSAPAATVVNFYVPDKDYSGNDILDPASGNDRSITLGQPTAAGKWLPLDPRDQTVVDPGPPVVVAPADIAATGNDANFVAKSVALRKSVAIAVEAGSAGLSPDDKLQYTLNVNLSDYFAMGKTLFGAGNLTIEDQLGDGQRLEAGSPMLTVYLKGVQYVIPLLVTTGAPGAGGTTLTFDIAQSIANTNAIFGGALVGDLAFDGDIEGATRAVITYRSTVAQAYTASYTQSEINEGDSVGNNATVSGTLLANDISLTTQTEEDTSAAALTVPTHTVATSIVTVNGAAPPANGELKPGDVVTFQLAYNLETGDYEQFKLTAYLPLPLFDLGAPGNFTGAWTYGSGDTNADNVDLVTVGAGNSLVFDFGSYVNNPDTNGKRIEVQFTLTVGNQPFADQRSLTVLGQSDQLTTIPTQQHLVSSGVVNIASIAEPVLAIKHGVVAVGAGSAGVVTGTTGTWTAAGSAGIPFTGSITDLAAVDGNVTGIDGGDLVRLATAIENTGGLGAFDVTTTVTLPTSFAFAGGSLAAANLAIYRGDGTALVLNTDYSVDTANNTITFLDPGTPPQPSLLPGRAGTAAETSGANVIVITYDVVAAIDIAASKSLQTSAALNYYSSVNGGTVDEDFTPGIDPLDTADQAIAAPVITKVFANGTLTDDDSSAIHTTGANLVIGESMLYDIVVTLPEGTPQSLRVNDLIPAGLTLDPNFETIGYRIITTAAESGALTADFAGTIGSVTASTSGGDGADLALTFGATTSADADNNAGNNSFVVRVRLIASNVSGNQAGVTRPNSAQVIYSDPDGNTPNGSTALDRTVAISGSEPSVSIVEPALSITQSASTNFQRPPGEVDAGDIVTYTITISNGTAASDFDAFDISFSDTVPIELAPLAIVAVIPAGGATASSADFTLSGDTLYTTGSANIDIPKGGSVTLIVTSQVSSNVANVASFTNTAQVRWTSLNGTNSTPELLERSGADGLLNGGSLNDYRRESALTLFVVSGGNMSHVGGLADTPAPSPTSQLQTVAVGEIIRYRVGFVLAEGSTIAASIKVALPDGLSFINDGTATIGLLSNTGIGNAADLTTGANPDIAGSVASMPDLLAADLSNTTTAVVNPSRINSTNPREILFSLGDLNNTDIDLNKEVIYLDFNVRVDNTAAVDTTKSLSTSAKLFAGGTQIDKTQPITENIVEPDLRNLQKTVTDFNPNTAGATGTATVTLAFSNSGDGIAYDSHLTDTMNGGNNYLLQSVIINGTTYLPGSLPGGVTVSTSGGITADFATIAIGTTVKLIYTVDVSNTAAHAPTNATLTWSSLPGSFTAYAGSNVGAGGTANGERDGSGTAPNTYIITEGAGLGYISGTLWDDTALASGVSTPDGPGIAGRTVTLTWAGLDGTPGNADDKSFTTTTDANGAYHFGVLAAGRFTVTSAATIADHNFGSGDDPVDDLAARIDTDSVGNDATVTIAALGEGASAAANIGYVRENDAPVNTVPGAQTTDEDVLLAIPGISVTDVDAGTGTMQMTLSVKHGVLNLTNTSGLASSSGLGTATMTITGSRSTLNTVLASLTYMPAANYNGNDTLKVQTSDLGQFGDVNGNGTPGENPADALLDTDTVAITVTPVNDAPVANPDTAKALEAGGWYNDIEGYPGYVNVLKNDTDVDIATNGDVLRVTRIGPGATANDAVSGDTSVVGLYGTLSIGPAGNATYVIDETNALVQALRQSGDALPTPEIFTYEMQDEDGVARTATITVTIKGANDTPVGNKDPVTGLPDGFNDEGVATEAGGEANGSGGSQATGNVLTNDVDVDAYGETKNVTAIRFGKESATTGVFTGVAAGTDSTTGTSVNGSYGTLKIGADGSYNYVVNDNATAVQRLVAGDTLIEYFSYVVTDALGDNDVAQIRITINGANDNPVASDDQAAAQAQAIAGGTVVGGVVTGGTEQGAEVNPTGNVILFQSRPGSVSPAPGNGIDNDVDRTDQPNSELVVTGIRTGAGNSDTTTGVTGATVIAGTYGTLTINPDGSFSYDVDSRNATVQGLNATETRTDTFTYKVADTAGLTDLAALNIIVRGINDPPVANDVFATAVEAGGIANGTPGTNPAGDATANDHDPDGDLISIVAARTSSGANIPIPGGGSIVLTSALGSLTLNANGNYSYVLNNANLDVQALRTSSNTLTDTFIYTLSDDSTPTPETDEAQIVITIEGHNDDPVGENDTAAALEAGGTSNTGGTNPTGNVLANDTDVDGGEIPADLPNFNYGETKAVSAFRSGTEAAGGGTTGVLGNEVRGLYGWLRLNADGSYAYRVDNDEPAVEALLDAGSTLADAFTYTVVDTAGATDTAQLTVTITGANDAPVAVADAGTAIEAGELNNGSAGTNPTGNVLTNDSDVDNGDSKTVTALTNSASVSGTLGTALAGSYGSLTLNANGSYSYVVDNTNTTVQGLRINNNTLTDTFTYIMKDTAGATSSTTLTITIRGANDNPLAANDTGTADEAGGLTPGSNATGDVLFNDTDVDNAAYGETKTVTTVRAGVEAGSGTAGSVGSALTGTYGALTLNTNGTYTYVVDNSNAAVQALRTTANMLSETFTYTMRDTVGATDIAQLTITIRGANDTPVAANNLAIAWPPIIGSPASGRNPTGNVLPNDSDVDAGDTKSVSRIRSGTEVAGGSMTTVTSGTSSGSGERVNGTYGWLNIGADGSYLYEVDFVRTASLAPTAIVQDYFTYELKDTGGLLDLAQLTVFIRGRNNPPIALPNFPVAVEAGGIANGTPGIDPAGDVTANDFDFEGDALSIDVIRTGLESGSGTAGTIGSELAGTYGWLTQQADGTFTYRVDNTNPLVQALRSSGDTLEELFTYTVSDIYGATDVATIAVTIQGANDNPVAVDDVATVDDPSALYDSSTGNVLPNDSDVDAYGETKTVASFANATGAMTGAGGSLAGKYGNLVLNSDGSYTYLVFNPDASVRAIGAAPAPGTLGFVEEFVYTVRDAAGATAQATLRITLDITTPRVDSPASPFFESDDSRSGHEIPVLNFTPIVYVERVVGQIERNINLSDRRNDGARPWLAAWPEIQSTSIGAGLGIDRDNFVKQAVESSRSFSRYDASIVDSRAGRVSLSADGLFPDDSIFTPDREENLATVLKPPKRSAAPSFSEQLRQSADRLRPLSGVPRPASQANDNPRRP